MLTETDYFASKIEYAAPQHVQEVIASLGRTEDVRFSPSNGRLAIAEFLKNRITLFDVSVIDGDPKKIALTDVAEISSTHLNWPHGLDFIDDEKLLVANRGGSACVFELPLATRGNHELTPQAVVSSGAITTPGSVSVSKRERSRCEALICNNYAHSVTRHLIDFNAGYSTTNSAVLLRTCLDIPDGICVSDDAQWIAVSNHSSHTVLLYENNSSLNESSRPDGILRCCMYPHGLRFTSDGRFLLVADSATPYVNIYEKDESGWRGVRIPLLSTRVLNDKDFLRGRHDHETGGPKGIDVSNANGVFVTTCEAQPLAFFDLAAVLEDACLCSDLQRDGASGATEKFPRDSNHRLPENWLRNKKMREVNYELDLHEVAKAELAALTNSKSWRITAPLRWASSVLKGSPL
jgi:hypothetical protein